MLIASWTAGLDDVHTKFRGGAIFDMSLETRKWLSTYGILWLAESTSLWCLMNAFVFFCCCCCKHSPSFHIFFHFFFIATSFHHFFQTNKQKTTKPSPKQEFQLSLRIFCFFSSKRLVFPFVRYIEGRFQNDFPKLLELLIFCRSEELPMSLCVFWWSKLTKKRQKKRMEMISPPPKKVFCF